MSRMRRADPVRVGPMAGIAALLAALAMAGSTPERAAAAPCPIPTYGLASGEFSLAGTPPCDDEAERFVLRCGAGAIGFDYHVNGVLQGTTGTGIPCSAAAGITVSGRYGEDELDLSAVTRAAGFTAIVRQNLIDGGANGDLLRGSGFADRVVGGHGNDVMLLRDGAPDVADCGEGVDAAQVDRVGIDSIMLCEIADLAPTPAKKCKKRKAKRRAAAVAARKCKRKPRLAHGLAA